MSVALAEGLSMRRINISLDQESDDWLTTQHLEDRINKSERIRALIVLARTDPEVAERAVQTADQLRKAKGGSA